MKRIFVAIVIAFFGLAVMDVGAQSSAVFRTVTGKVEIQSPGAAAWTPASAGMEVPIKATISTGFGGGAVVQVGNATLTIRQLTRLRIDELTSQNNVNKTNLVMPVGRIRAEVKTASGTTSDFKLRGPVSTASVRGTGFESDGVNLSCFESVVAFLSQSGISVDVHAGESGVASNGGAPTGGTDQRDADTGVDTDTSSTGGGGVGNGVTGSVGTIAVSWQ
jgi:hypothetical protein